MSGTPGLEEVISIATEAAIANIEVCLVCTVVSYDVDNQTANLRPVMTRRVPNPDGGTVVETLPDIPAVRVCHPGGASWSLHVPIKAGDAVAILCSKLDFSEWLRTGNRSATADQRVFSLSFAIALPGLRRVPISGASADDVTFIHESGFKVSLKSTGVMEVGGNSDSAALASKCNQIDSRIAATIASFLPGSGGASFATAYSAVGDTASTKLKVGG